MAIFTKHDDHYVHFQSYQSCSVDIEEYIKDFGVVSLLNRIPISDIEKYLRKKKLENIKS